MMGVCLRYAKDRDDAQDILHEGFMKVFDNLAKFSNKGSFEGWVRRIMVNMSIDHIRKNRQEYLIVDTVYADKIAKKVADEPEDEDKLINSITQEEVMKAMQQLSPAYRAVFNLYIIEEYSHKEIADMLDISEGTSKSNLAKAKYNFKKHLTRLIKT
jgi:RNA polymerase sigma factor (sigma-70 family)